MNFHFRWGRQQNAAGAQNSYDPHAFESTYSITGTATFSAKSKNIVATSYGVTYARAAIYGALVFSSFLVESHTDDNRYRDHVVRSLTLII
jgi:hypothetical protein